MVVLRRINRAIFGTIFFTVALIIIGYIPALIISLIGFFFTEDWNFSKELWNEYVLTIKELWSK